MNTLLTKNLYSMKNRIKTINKFALKKVQQDV